MSFLQNLDKFITTPHIVVPVNKPRNTHWPTEASFRSSDGKVIGKCLRQVWYNYKGFKPTNPVDEKGQSIFDLGDMVQEWYVERAKRMGVWAADSVRYYDDKYNISSEIDLLIFEEEELPDLTTKQILVGVECKSAYGHFADKELKTGPKTDHLMQVCLNLDFLNRLYADKPQILWSKKFYIEYFMRDSCLRYEHVVELKEIDGMTYPVVNGIEVTTFNLEGVYARYEELNVIKNFEEAPARDFTYAYEKSEVESKYKAGEISKSKYQAYIKGKTTISDWQCVYCQHLDTCWPDKRRALKERSVDELVEAASNGVSIG